MRYTVSKCIKNRHAGPSSPPCLSYWRNGMPSGWYLFPVNICPVRHRPYNPFRHLRRPTSILLLYRISATILSRRCLNHWHYLPYLLSWISTAPQLLSSRVSVALLITLSSIVPCTSPPLSIYLLWSDLLPTLRFSILHCLIRSAPHYFSNSSLWSVLLFNIKMPVSLQVGYCVLMTMIKLILY